MKRRVASGGEPGGEGRSNECELSVKYPHLFEFLTERAYDDGSEREPGTMTVFLERGWLKACLNDKDGGMVAFVASESLAGLLGACDEGLAYDNLDWRQQKAGPRKPNKST
jgi:hypothetical protein